MDERPRRRTGGRDARHAARLHAEVEHEPFLTRTLAPYEVLNEEGLSLIEWNADTILQEVGIDFRGDETRETLRLGGADVDGRARAVPARPVPLDHPGQRAATVHAVRPQPRAERHDRRMHMVFAPNYGSPFVRDLDGGRRYGTIEDFRNFVKLTYLRPHLHHSGGTVCEPVDLPVNKRHFDMVYATCAGPTSRSWARSRTRNVPATPWRWRASCSVRRSSTSTPCCSAS